MKKTILIPIAFILMFISCKKDFTCECKAKGITDNYEISKMKKSDAEALCTKWSTTSYFKDGGSCILK